MVTTPCSRNTRASERVAGLARRLGTVVEIDADQYHAAVDHPLQRVGREMRRDFFPLVDLHVEVALVQIGADQQPVAALQFLADADFEVFGGDPLPRFLVGEIRHRRVAHERAERQSVHLLAALDEMLGRVDMAARVHAQVAATSVKELIALGSCRT